jgi:dihydrofolate reductase
VHRKKFLDDVRDEESMTRPRCAAFLAMSLDGFIARPDGRVDWLDAYEAPPEDYAAFIAGVDTLLIGRATYDLVVTFPAWPYEAKRVAVLTHRPQVPRHGETFLAGEPAAVLARLAASGSRSVYVDGGAVVSQYLAAGLLDELTVTVVPLVLGTGRRLFQGTLPERRFSLVENRVYSSGLVRITYRPT